MELYIINKNKKQKIISKKICNSREIFDEFWNDATDHEIITFQIFFNFCK